MAKDKDGRDTEDDFAQITSEIHSWEHEGDSIIGKVLEIVPFTLGKFDTEVNQYLIQCGDTIVSTVLGSATDKAIAGKVKPGVIVKIIYGGKKALADGRQVNSFKVFVKR